ncbi:hypothetical protein AMAG_05619 [Allomyces macrogynus ATCC 38327]|uniref:Ubinuclein middle domain-containing protein n=1 Tax=Allomyces macrogynus (strain ATCC 38327) TaxID=578462 RepID=A0A0L0SCT1_ALLM3|nr:hypothetical protein AMAG_05619 [Allomyces macrogynus ATCC 38327]|eukprot:KNE60200.1 hypothetical protein AMAG_05619 [Allomyces macrogynus ATCC 38327]
MATAPSPTPAAAAATAAPSTTSSRAARPTASGPAPPPPVITNLPTSAAPGTSSTATTTTSTPLPANSTTTKPAPTTNTKSATFSTKPKPRALTIPAAPAPPPPTYASTYVHDVTLPLVASSHDLPLHLGAESLGAPATLDARQVIMASHGGVLPAEFALRKWTRDDATTAGVHVPAGGGAGSTSDDEDDEDEEQTDTDREAATAAATATEEGGNDVEGADAEADSEMGWEDSEEHEDVDGDDGSDTETPKDADSDTPVSATVPTPPASAPAASGGGFLESLLAKYPPTGPPATAPVSGKPVVAAKPAPAKSPTKRRRREEWYDSDDSFIDDSDEFIGNVGLLKPVRSGFFMVVGPVNSEPLEGVTAVEASEGLSMPMSKDSMFMPQLKRPVPVKKPASAPSSSLSLTATGAKPSATNKPDASAASSSNKSAPAKVTSLAPTPAPSQPAPSAPSASGHSTTTRVVLIYNRHSPVTPDVEKLLQEYHALTRETDWRNKSKFPEHLEEPIWQLVRTHFWATQWVPAEEFLVKLIGTMPYNQYTVKRLIARLHVPKMVEILDVDINQQIDDLEVTAKADLWPQEQAKQEADAVPPSGEGTAKQRRRTKMPPAIRQKLDDIGETRLWIEQLLLWRTYGHLRTHHLTEGPGRPAINRNLFEQVGECFPPGYLKITDIANLPFWDRYLNRLKEQEEDEERAKLALAAAKKRKSNAGTAISATSPASSSAPLSSSAPVTVPAHVAPPLSSFSSSVPISSTAAANAVPLVSSSAPASTTTTTTTTNRVVTVPSSSPTPAPPAPVLATSPPLSAHLGSARIPTPVPDANAATMVAPAAPLPTVGAPPISHVIGPSPLRVMLLPASASAAAAAGTISPTLADPPADRTDSPTGRPKRMWGLRTLERWAAGRPAIQAAAAEDAETAALGEKRAAVDAPPPGAESGAKRARPAETWGTSGSGDESAHVDVEVNGGGPMVLDGLMQLAAVAAAATGAAAGGQANGA